MAISTEEKKMGSDLSQHGENVSHLAVMKEAV
jgi:hypothetical protein